LRISVSAHLATERALELFAPVQQADYVGWNGSGVGPKGQDDTLLGGYEIVDDPPGAQNAAPTAEGRSGRTRTFANRRHTYAGPRILVDVKANGRRVGAKRGVLRASRGNTAIRTGAATNSIGTRSGAVFFLREWDDSKELRGK